MFSWHNMTTLRARSRHLWVPTQDLPKINPGKISAWVQVGSWSSATSRGVIGSWWVLRWGTQLSSGPLVDCPCSRGQSCIHALAALDLVWYGRSTWGWEEDMVEYSWFKRKEQDWVWLKTHCVHKQNSQRINKNLLKREKNTTPRRKLSKSQKLTQMI